MSLAFNRQLDQVTLYKHCSHEEQTSVCQTCLHAARNEQMMLMMILAVNEELLMNCDEYVDHPSLHPDSHTPKSIMKTAKYFTQNSSKIPNLYSVYRYDCCLVDDYIPRSLWSADVYTCIVPRTYSSYGDRTFAADGPRLWNALPVQLCNPDITYGLFRWQLKGHLFGNHGHGTLWLLICSALEKHLLTYLLMYI